MFIITHIYLNKHIIIKVIRFTTINSNKYNTYVNFIFNYISSYNSNVFLIYAIL